MLASLTIRDFAIVDELTVEWAPGLTALTGETGAGKSILLDAVGALLGDKVGAADVRAGAARAYLEAVFELDSVPEARSALTDALDELGVEPEESTLFVSRDVVSSSGSRGVARINGRAVPLASLARVGQTLVDVHGQSQHLSLLRPRDQLEQLDRFAALDRERREMFDLARELRAVRQRIEALVQESRAAAREQDLLRFQVEEIAAAALLPDEEASIQARRSKLRNVERLRGLVHGAYEGIAGGDETTGGLEQVGNALKSVSDAVRLDEALRPFAESLIAAETHLEDAERGLRNYLDALDADPSELEALEERALTIAELKRKYGATVEEVLDYLRDTSERLDRIEHADERLAALEVRGKEVAASAATIAAALSAGRRAAAIRLERAVDSELRDLGMSGARVRVGFSVSEAGDGLRVGLGDGEARTLRFDATGVDRVELQLAANPGEEPRPLAQVASGGELARVALAIKTVLSAGDERGTLIFDEVDVGVGGRTAGVVGQKLWQLSRTHQVLCVTHLPQVAAYADTHLLVVKEEREGRNRTLVRQLDPQERVAELASMLAGPRPSPTALLNARELLERAQSAKH